MDWVDHFGEPAGRLMVDYFNDDGDLPGTISTQVEREAKLYGITAEQFLQTLQASYSQGR
jgi:hypothetical protein